MTDRSGVLPAAVAALVLGAMFVTALLITTPWSPLDVPDARAAAAAPALDFTATERDREDAYHRQLRPPVFASLAVGLGLILLLGLTPLGARLVTAVARPLPAWWGWQVLAGGLAVLLVGRLATLPLSAAAETVQRRYGLSTRDWPAWALDVAKGFGLSAVVTLAALLGLLGLVRALPRWWFAPASLAGAALVVVVSFGYPLVVEPVFNRFTSLTEEPLRTSLLELAERDGVPVDDILVADASRRTTTLNAYVSGLGATRRIVVYDTLVESSSPQVVRLVVAHELGHTAARDVLRGTVLGALGLAAAVCVLALTLSWVPLRRVAGVTTLADPRSVALVLAVVTVLSTLAGPVQSLVSRRIEARADVHALELTRDPTGFIRMQRTLALSSLSDLDPHPLVFGLFATHPTAPQRIALARDWAAVNGVAAPAALVDASGPPR